MTKITPMKPTLYIIGTGPGDPELLTIKAIRILEKCHFLVAPKAVRRNGSTALSIVAQAMDISGKEILEVPFAMQKVHLDAEVNNDVLAAWRDTAKKTLELLDRGCDVAFPTLGDPGIYSTGYYLYDTLLTMRPDVQVRFIPGVPAMSSCSANTASPVCLGDDRLAVIPATFSDSKIRETLLDFDAIILMKVGKVMDRICSILAETGLTEYAVYVEKAGMADERIVRDLSTVPEKPHYFSIVMVRKKGVGPLQGRMIPAMAPRVTQQ